MARAYAKVLEGESVGFRVVTRGASKGAAFAKETGVKPEIGGLDRWLKSNPAPETAIVAVGAEALAKSALALIAAGTRRLLVEKPAGLTLAEIRAVDAAARRRRAKVFVAYNRRFFASAAEARRLIAEDGGPLSFHFEFTEWAEKVAASPAAPAVKRSWVLANSSHPIDLAFFLGGMPKSLSATTAGSLPWHPKAAVFAGSGATARKVPFSYHANWLSPGRWSVEVMTARRRLFLRPLEQLAVQNHGELAASPVALDDRDDRLFKPGLRGQVRAFLSNGHDLRRRSRSISCWPAGSKESPPPEKKIEQTLSRL
jgi:predicted dehydrogenase